MKKITISFLAGFFLLCGVARAQTASVQVVGDKTETKYLQGVLGIDVSGIGVDITDGLDNFVEDAYSAITLSAGVKVNNQISLTGFYQFSSEEDKTTYAYLGYDNYLYEKTTGSFKAYGVDASVYLPVSEKVNFIASAGVGYYDFSVDFKDSFSDGSYAWGTYEEDHIGLRFGIGAEVKLAEHIALTGNVRYVFLDYDDDTDYIENLAEFGLGVRFYF